MDSANGIIVCADDPLARAGLAALIGSFDEVVLVAQVDSRTLTGEVFLPDHAPAEAIVWDVGWNGVRELIDLAAVEIPTVALIGDEDQARVVWRAGSRGLIWRTTPEDELIAAVLAVCAGFTVLAPGLTEIVSRPTSTAPGVPTENLTTRESDVLILVAQGLTNKAIGQQLAISEHTVKFHLNAILGKLGAQSRTEAVVKATRQGLISL